MRHVVTKEGKIKLIEELNHLNSVEKPRIINELSEARERGSLEENHEYMTAKEEYEKLQNKIENLQNLISSSVIVSRDNITTNKVSILTNVKVVNVLTNKEMMFKIVPDNEIDIKLGKISTNSPIGSGLIGKTLGDVCEISTPKGKMNFKILDISI